LLLTIAIGVGQPLLERIASLTVELAAADEAGGELELSFMTAACFRATFGARHRRSVLPFWNCLFGIALEVWNQSARVAGVCGIQDARLAQLAFTRAALGREQMAQVGLLMFDLAGLAHGKALGGAAIGLQFAHRLRLLLQVTCAIAILCVQR